MEYEIRLYSVHRGSWQLLLKTNCEQYAFSMIKQFADTWACNARYNGQLIEYRVNAYKDKYIKLVESELNY